MGRIVRMTESAFNTSLFGNSSNYMGNYLQHQMNRMQHAGMNLVNDSLFNTLQRSHEYVTDASRQYNIMRELQNHDLCSMDDFLVPCYSFEELQVAKPSMQRYLMSEPTLRQVYLDGNCDGYSDTYSSPYSTGVGDLDYNYRRVVDGVQRFDENGDGYIVRYIEPLDEGDTDLHIYEQVAILNSWDTIRTMMRNSQYDFTRDSDSPELMNL